MSFARPSMARANRWGSPTVNAVSASPRARKYVAESARSTASSALNSLFSSLSLPATASSECSSSFNHSTMSSRSGSRSRRSSNASALSPAARFFSSAGRGSRENDRAANPARWNAAAATTRCLPWSPSTGSPRRTADSMASAATSNASSVLNLFPVRFTLASRSSSASANTTYPKSRRSALKVSGNVGPPSGTTPSFHTMPRAMPLARSRPRKFPLR